MFVTKYHQQVNSL